MFNFLLQYFFYFSTFFLLCNFFLLFVPVKQDSTLFRFIILSLFRLQFCIFLLLSAVFSYSHSFPSFCLLFACLQITPSDSYKRSPALQRAAASSAVLVRPLVRSFVRFLCPSISSFVRHSFGSSACADRYFVSMSDRCPRAHVLKRITTSCDVADRHEYRRTDERTRRHTGTQRDTWTDETDAL